MKEGELFPYRRNVEFLNTDMNVPIEPLIEKLSFVTNTAYWAIALRKGYTQITEKDFKLITESASLASTP